jgi:hypothetical protein
MRQKISRADRVLIPSAKSFLRIFDLLTLTVCTSLAQSPNLWQPHTPITIPPHEAGLLVWVTDSSGAVVENAAVVLVNSATGARIEGKTNPYGVFTSRGLLPQTYEVTASSPGFRDGKLSATPSLGTLKEISLNLSLASDSAVIYVGRPNLPIQFDLPIDLGVRNLQSHRVIELVPIKPLPPQL